MAMKLDALNEFSPRKENIGTAPHFIRTQSHTAS